MQKNKKVYVLGTDGIGWSIDKDRDYAKEAIRNIENYEVTNNYFSADIVYIVWWNQLLSWKFKLLNFFLKKKIIACITNDLVHQIDFVKSIFPIVEIFVYANTKQKNILLENGINKSKLYFNPFYVDNTIFKKLNIDKLNICKKFNININDIKNKYLIGSFQRDSIGSNILESKWQKDPDMLIHIMKSLDRDKYVLVLAGPRRHYIISQCKIYNINYIFLGNEAYITEGKDDLLVNAVTLKDMPYLYNLIDLYIVSSKSEGGPKAIPEAILCGTNIISTDVGFAKDLLNDKALYIDSDDAVKKINNQKFATNHKVSEFYSFDLFKNRIEKILERVKL